MSDNSVSVANKKSLLNLAHEGVPEAISAILSSYCKYRGTQVTNIQVRWKEGNLFILCEANTELQQQEVVQPFGQILRKLGMSDRLQITLYARVIGQTKPLWSVSLQSQAKASPADLEQWLNQGRQQPSTQPEFLRHLDQFHSDSKQQSKSRFLRFKLGTESGVFQPHANDGKTSHEGSVLLPLAQIQEVLDIPKTSILPVPYMTSCVLGIYNYRGNMLWLVDLAQQLGDRSSLSNSSHHPTLSILVVSREDGELIGFSVSKVLDIEDYHIEELELPNPSFFSELFFPFIEYYLPQSLSPILNIQALINDPKLQYH